MILSNKNLKLASRAMIKTTKNSVNINTANVIPQVDLRSGQRTCRNSIHEPLKYPPIDASSPKGFFKTLTIFTIATPSIYG